MKRPNIFTYQASRRRLPDVLTVEELNRLLNTPNHRYPTGMRNYCILMLMANAGLRVGEVVSLKLHDIDWMSGRVAIRSGKYDRDRVVYINQGDLESLQKWRQIRGEKVNGSSDYLFTTLQDNPVTTKYVREMIKRMAKRAGLSKDIHPHLLRHTFATDLLRHSGNIRVVQSALGHADVSTTMIYTHVVGSDVENAMRSLRNG